MHAGVIGFEEGPWHPNAVVLESTDYGISSSIADWEAVDGAMGTLHSNPPQIHPTIGDPLMAMSNLASTWPASGWPAPESLQEVWWGTEMWNKWKRTEGAETYGEFNDNYADRDNEGEDKSMDISGRLRMIQFGAIPGAFYQIEYTNNSSWTYTDVFVGMHIRRRLTYSDGNYAFPRWDQARQVWYPVGPHYFDQLLGPGTHSDDDITSSNQQQAPWACQVYLESPTGSRRTDLLDVEVDNPGTVVTRVAWVTYGDRLQQAAHHEWGYYGAMSGEASYFDDPLDYENVWKQTGARGGTGPALMQDEHDWARFWHQVDDMTDALTIISPTNGFYGYHSSGPVDWAPGEQLNWTWAFVGGITEQDMLANADKAIKTYQKQFATSGPPAQPALIAEGGMLTGPEGAAFDPRVHGYKIAQVSSGDITITWDGEAAETSVDAITGNQDFQGYRLFGWIPLATYDIDDGISGMDPATLLDLGTDSGLVHSFTDGDVLDGFEYWYALTTYDYDPTQDPVNFSFQTSIGSNPNSDNVLAVIASSDPNGFQPGSIDDPVDGLVGMAALTPTLGTSDGIVTVQVMDNRAMGDFNYRISTTDTAVYGGVTFTNTVGITLENLTTSQVLYQSMLPESATFGSDVLPVREGLMVTVDSNWNLATRSDVASSTYPSILDDNYPMRWPDAGFWSGDLDPDVLAEAAQLFSARIDFDTTATQMAYVWTRDTATGYGYPYRSYNEFPGTAWDVSDPLNPRQINIGYTVNDIDTTNGDDWDLTDSNSSTGQGYHRSTLFRSDYSGATPDATYTGSSIRYDGLDMLWQFQVALNDTFTAQFPTSEAYLHGTSISYDYLAPMGPGLQYDFSTTAPAIVDSLIDMDAIQVVPNPYRIYAEWDLSPIERKIQFTNVPANCRVDIYTITGDLVASLGHGTDYLSDRMGTVEWRIWTYEYTDVAYGLYLYVVKSDDGKYKKVGKFAIIR
jgi:hypothetical protein